MIKSVLVVCVGNICRSPMGERLLAQALPGVTVSSAGIAAVVGAAADDTATATATEIGLDLGGHIARQITAELGAAHDLILVMEPGHRAELTRRFPQLSGRAMLFDHWIGGKGISDPYRKSMEAHRQTRDRIAQSAKTWADQLRRGGRST